MATAAQLESHREYAALAALGFHRWVYIEPEMQQYESDDDYDEDDYEPEQYEDAADAYTTTLVAVDAKEGEDTCFVCLDKVPDCKFVDCNHGHICCICADRLIKESGKCPLCRLAVTRYELVQTTTDDDSSDLSALFAALPSPGMN